MASIAKRIAFVDSSRGYMVMHENCMVTHSTIGVMVEYQAPFMRFGRKGFTPTNYDPDDPQAIVHEIREWPLAKEFFLMGGDKPLHGFANPRSGY
jgi:hypothetical protein